MIDEIVIKNFQIHENLIIKLKRGLNVIIGDTDAGKSSIIRALNLLLRNQPRSGEAIFKNKHTKKNVDITVKSNGNIIQRKNHKYFLNGQELKAFDKNVPLPIIEILPVNDINLQKQFDQHFLIFQTGGTAAKTLNSSTGMEDQELLMQLIKSDIASHKSNINRLLKNNEEHQQTIQTLSKVSRTLVQANNVKSMENTSEQYKNKIFALEHLLIEIHNCRLNQKSQKIFDSILHEIGQIELNQNKYNKINYTTENLSDIVQRLQSIYQTLNNQKIYNNIFNAIISIESNLKTIQEINRAVKEIHTALKNITEFRVNREDIENKLAILNNNFEDKLIELGECPFCGTKFTQEKCRC